MCKFNLKHSKTRNFREKCFEQKNQLQNCIKALSAFKKKTKHNFDCRFLKTYHFLEIVLCWCFYIFLRDVFLLSCNILTHQNIHWLTLSWSVMTDQSLLSSPFYKYSQAKMNKTCSRKTVCESYMHRSPHARLFIGFKPKFSLQSASGRVRRVDSFKGEDFRYRCSVKVMKLGLENLMFCSAFYPREVVT